MDASVALGPCGDPHAYAYQEKVLTSNYIEAACKGIVNVTMQHTHDCLGGTLGDLEE